MISWADLIVNVPFFLLGYTAITKIILKIFDNSISSLFVRFNRIKEGSGGRKNTALSAIWIVILEKVGAWVELGINIWAESNYVIGENKNEQKNKELKDSSTNGYEFISLLLGLQLGACGLVGIF